MRVRHHLETRGQKTTSFSRTHVTDSACEMRTRGVYDTSESGGKPTVPAQRFVPGLAVYPGTPHSLHLTEIPLPAVGPREAEVRVLTAGICGTDREIIEAHFGRAPEGESELVIGHEVLGVVEIAGPESGLRPGDLVSATARRGCGCPPCAAGASDFCVTLGYRERGILGLHGYFTERFVESADQLIPVPTSLASVGVLIEPVSVPEKALRVAFGTQSRIVGWTPRTAVVYGAGPIGLLTTLIFRARGLDVYTLDIKPTPNPAEAIVRACGGVYVDLNRTPVADLRDQVPNVDLIVECTGTSAVLPDATALLGNNGVLVLLSVTGGSRELTIPADRLYLQFVLGNKTMVGSVNSSIADFNAAVADLISVEQQWPGLTQRLMTHRIEGLANALEFESTTRGAVKAVIDVV